MLGDRRRDSKGDDFSSEFRLIQRDQSIGDALNLLLTFNPLRRRPALK